jgi:hypothetical protein
MKLRNKWLISFLHSFVLLTLSLIWLHTPFTYGDEKFLIKWTAVVKRLVLQMDDDLPKDNFMFINLAYEKALIPLEDNLGNEVITDRAALAKFFKILQKHPDAAKFTICDVFLKGKSPYDSLLSKNIAGVPNIVFPTHTDDNNKPEKLEIKVPSAMSNYKSADEGFVKFTLLLEDEYKTIPLYMYEKLQKRNYSHNWGLYWDNGNPCLNSVIIDYKIRKDEVFENGKYPVVNLSELMLLPEELIVKEFLQGRIIVMGDFMQDKHKTTFGVMPGSLILLNVYLSLIEGAHLISLSWLLFMILAFTLYSRIIIFNWQQPSLIKSSKWFLNLLKSVTLLAIISVCSYFLFNIGIQVLFLTIYTGIILFTIRLWKEKAPIHKIQYWLTYISEK